MATCERRDESLLQRYVRGAPARVGYLPEGHRFPMQKYRLLRQAVEAAGLFAEGDLRTAPPATDQEILRAHDPDYLRRLMAGDLTVKEIRRIGLPSHELSLVATIALRFVPLLAEQLEIIMKAQASRGADIGYGGRLAFVRTARQVAVLIVPLFVDAFRRAEDLILAMQARCYVGGRGRSSYVRLKFGRADAWAYLAGGLFSLAILALRTTFPV